MQCFTGDRLWGTLVIQADRFQVYFSLPKESFILDHIRVLFHNECQQEGHNNYLKHKGSKWTVNSYLLNIRCVSYAWLYVGVTYLPSMVCPDLVWSLSWLDGWFEKMALHLSHRLQFNVMLISQDGCRLWRIGHHITLIGWSSITDSTNARKNAISQALDLSPPNSKL